LKDMKFSYGQLRAILGLALENGTVRLRLEDFLTGKLVNLNEMELLELVRESGVDLELLHILTGSDPATLDAVDALETVAAFFAYWRASKPKLDGWLGSLGFAVTSATTPSRGSK
jgi:hypothetical protein